MEGEENGGVGVPVEGDGPRVVGKRCFVGNLAWKTSWQDLKDKFRECGNVVYANVMRGDDNRSKGWGIVEYENVEEAEAAINTLNGIELDGRPILVREDREDRDLKGPGEPREHREHREHREPREHRPPREGRGGSRGGRGGGRGSRGPPERTGESSGLQVVVQGIPWSYTWKELKDMFADIDGLDRADVVSGSDGRSRGFGTVRFTTPESAQAAIANWNEQDLEGRTLAVFLDKYA